MKPPSPFRVKRSALVIVMSIVLAHSRADNNSESKFEFSATNVSTNLVMIECTHGDSSLTGCGFIANMDGKTYLVTSQRLLLGAEKIKFSSPISRSIKPRSVELACTRDIARLALTEGEAFSLSENPAMGAAVGVFSSSIEQPAAARYGTITGVGADIIEISAEFSDEHSGSPILDLDRRVIGIASYVRESRSHAMKKGTKFENTTRRFCYRLDRTNWTPVKWKQYNEQYGSVYLESKLLIDNIIELLNRWADAPFERVHFEGQPGRVLSNWEKSHNKVVRDYTGSDSFQRKFFSDYSESTRQLAEVCQRRANKIRMVAEQRGLSPFMLNEYKMQADTLDYTAKIIEYYSASTDY